MNERKNALILGNGFDLDLELETRFSDFAKSEEFWPKDNGSQLAKYLKSKADLNNWFDLEQCLLNFLVGPKAQHRNSKNDTIEGDLDYFELLRHNLMLFIADKEKKPIKKNCLAAKILNAVCDNSLFKYVYSLNYTDLNNIAKQLGLYDKAVIYHLHGSVKTQDIIIGIGDTPVRSEYANWRKSRSPFYRPNRIFGDLTKAKEVIFFGVSFGSIDSKYFAQFFKMVSKPTDEPIDDKDRRGITIFTYDEKGRTFILDRLVQMGVDLEYLYSQTDFSIIRTKDNMDNYKVEECLTRLKRGRPSYVPEPMIV